ncbi:MAG TPA: hypothetical protein VN084_03215 [Methylophilaceae bacterium]|nr:hypothetical protein [Methylophilaceae bacterium]
MRIFAIAAAFGLLTLPALGAPTAEQKAEFYAVCMGIAQDETLCSCKADAAMTLIDADFMAMVISAMQGGSVPQDEYSAYNAYVAKSNQICKPNY